MIYLVAQTYDTVTHYKRRLQEHGITTRIEAFPLSSASKVLLGNRFGKDDALVFCGPWGGPLDLPAYEWLSVWRYTGDADPDERVDRWIDTRHPIPEVILASARASG